MKRVTPSFTVEYRQAKRPNTGSAKLGWAHAKPAPAGVDEKANRIAISAFKTVAAHPPADVISPSIPPGRILPSLVEAAPVTGQADAGGAQSRSYGGAAKAGHVTQVAADGTLARASWRAHLSCRRPRAVDRCHHDTSVKAARRPRTRALQRRERQDRRNGPGVLQKSKRSSTTLLVTSAEGAETAPVSSTSGLPPVGKPSSTTRTSRILDRYVFRDELSPGESWKRRIEARRERRA